METRLADFIRDTAPGREADRILRACVHCGFCNATCPTYQILGDELDGPRGRIYQMKQVLEGAPASALTRLHLDRCLTCRSCETTCPSGVQYGRLLDIGRELVERQAPRPAGQRLQRLLLRRFLLSPALFGNGLGAGRWLRPLLPESLRRRIPPRVDPGARPAGGQPRRMLVLEGCVQPALTPQTNAAAARVLARLGIALLAAPGAGCCGAISHHLSAPAEARDHMRRNIDAWWPHIEAGAEAIVMTASGCGAMVRDYGHLLADDPGYAAKAARISALTRDLGEVLAAEDLSPLRPATPRRVAFHPPCSLQHAQRVRGVIEAILTRLGHQLVPVAEAHLCCGSAGTYSILQPRLAGELRARKLASLQAGAPELIATANIGCQLHLGSAADVPVVHWVSLLDPG
jgi:glycolate oxidase iron-sulfur subunit